MKVLAGIARWCRRHNVASVRELVAGVQLTAASRERTSPVRETQSHETQLHETQLHESHLHDNELREMHEIQSSQTQRHEPNRDAQVPEI